MTIEDKKLLIQDLSCRLPYGVKIQFNDIITSPAILKGINKDFIECDIAICELEDIKPYLFPLTEENIEKAINESNEFYSKIISLDWDSDEETYKLNIPKRLLLRSKIYSSVVNYFYKHHIDYNGLIEKDLAIDASELDIY